MNQIFELELEPISNGFLLNRISNGEIVPSTKGKTLEKIFIKDQEDLKENISKVIGYALPMLTKNKKIKFSIEIKEA